MSTYTVKLTFGDTLTFEANLAEASAPIRIIEEEGGSQLTPYQTADAQHDPMEAAVLLIKNLGPHYWLNPEDDKPENEDEYIRQLIAFVA